jgi:hypothetical protein
MGSCSFLQVASTMDFLNLVPFAWGDYLTPSLLAGWPPCRVGALAGAIRIVSTQINRLVRKAKLKSICSSMNLSLSHVASHWLYKNRKGCCTLPISTIRCSSIIIVYFGDTRSTVLGDHGMLLCRAWIVGLALPGLDRWLWTSSHSCGTLQTL